MEFFFFFQAVFSTIGSDYYWKLIEYIYSLCWLPLDNLTSGQSMYHKHILDSICIYSCSSQFYKLKKFDLILKAWFFLSDIESS